MELWIVWFCSLLHTSWAVEKSQIFIIAVYFNTDILLDWYSHPIPTTLCVITAEPVKYFTWKKSIDKGRFTQDAGVGHKAGIEKIDFNYF